MPPIPRKPLILYILAKDTSLSILLSWEDQNNKEKAIYYVNQTIVFYKMNYSIIEKACLAIVFSWQKLRHYTLANTTCLITKVDPLKYLLRKATLIGRLAKGVMILNEFNIEYVERKVIEG